MKQTLRKFKLADNYSNGDTSRDITMLLSLPVRANFIVLDQTFGSGPTTENTADVSDIVYNTDVKSKVVSMPSDLTTVYNTPVDDEYKTKTDNDRFKLIAILESLDTMNKATVFYDRKYTDMFLLPDLSSYGTTGNSDLFKYRTFKVSSYAIGGTPKMNDQDLFMVNFDEYNIVLPEPDAVTDTKTHLLDLPGFGQYSAWNNKGIKENDGLSYLESSINPPVQMVSLGSDLFNNTPVPVSLLVANGVKSITPVYIGKQIAVDYLLPISL